LTGFTTPPSGPAACTSSGTGYCLQDAVFVDNLGICPDCGLIIYQDHTTIAGGKHYDPGVYLQYTPFFPGPFSTGIDPSQVFRILASALPSGADISNTFVFDALTAAGDLSAGTFGGRAANYVYPQFGPPQGGTAETYWTISAVKNGTQLSGTIVKTQRVWDWAGYPHPPPNAQMFNYGDATWTFSFTATRIK
jgi:hypothetical protein